MGSVLAAKFSWRAHSHLGLTLHISDFLNTEGLTFIPESVTSQFMFKQSKAIQKLLQVGIRAVVD